MFVYVIINKENGQHYIGKYEGKLFSTYRKRVWREALQYGKKSKPHLYNALRKYGESEFLFAPIVEFNDKQVIRDLEAALIESTNAISEGYNITKGHEPPSMLGKKFSQEHRRKISESSKGRKHSPEIIKLIADKNRGHKSNPAQLAALAKGWNRTVTDAHRKEMSERVKRQWEELPEDRKVLVGIKTKNYWASLTPEQKFERISKAKEGQKNAQARRRL